MKGLGPPPPIFRVEGGSLPSVTQLFSHCIHAVLLNSFNLGEIIRNPSYYCCLSISDAILMLYSPCVVWISQVGSCASAGEGCHELMC